MGRFDQPAKPFPATRPIDARDLKRARATHEQEQRLAELSHIPGAKEVRNYFAEMLLPARPDLFHTANEGVLKRLPWKTEPVLVEHLQRARAEHASQAGMNGLRDFIYASLWATHGRVTKEDAKRMITKIAESDAEKAKHLREMSGIASREEHKLHRRAIAMDPDTSREAKAFIPEQMRPYQVVLDAIANNATGDDLEQAVRIVEDLQLAAYKHLEKMKAAHGEKDLDDVRQRPEGAAAAKRIDDLRPLRDYLYFRRLHSDWIKRAER